MTESSISNSPNCLAHGEGLMVDSIMTLGMGTYRTTLIPSKGNTYNGLATYMSYLLKVSLYHHTKNESPARETLGNKVHPNSCKMEYYLAIKITKTDDIE